MHTAIIEFDALTDAVRATTENHDFFVVGRARFAFFVIARIHVCGGSGEFGRTGIDAFVHRTNIERVTSGADLSLFSLQEVRQSAIRETLTLDFAQFLSTNGFKRFLLNRQFTINQFLDLRKKPRIYFCVAVNFFERHTDAERIGHIPKPLTARVRKLITDFFRINRLQIETIDAGFQTAQCLLQRLLEIAADGHHFANAFHLRRQPIIGLREFLERKSWHFRDDVIDRRLE